MTQQSQTPDGRDVATAGQPVPAARRPWYRTPGLTYLICYCISAFAIHFWLNQKSDVRATGAVPANFRVLVLDTAMEAPALKVVGLETWQKSRDDDSGLQLEMKAGQGTLPADPRGFEKVSYTIQPQNNKVDVTVYVEMEKGGIECAYRIDAGRVIPLTIRNVWPLAWALLFAFMNAFLLLLPAHFLIRFWEWRSRTG